MLLQVELLSRMGLALLEIQQTEQVLRKCMKFVRVRRFSWEQIMAEEDKERTRTLGHFIRELKKYTDVRKDFQEELASFLRDRNFFVHDIRSVPHFSLSSDAGMKAGLTFLISLTKQAVHVRKLLVGYINLIMRKGIFKPGIEVGPGVTEDEMYDLLAIGVFAQSNLDRND